VALVPLVLVSMMAAAFLQLAGVMARNQNQALSLKRVFYLCEAGLHEAMSGLYQGRTGNVGTEDAPAYFGDGYFWVEARQPAPGLVQLDSFAFSNGAQAHLSWVVQKIQFNFSAFGFFSSGKLKVKKGSLIDGYDSMAGSYEAQVAAGLTELAGRLATNEGIELEGKPGLWTYVNGSAQPGLGSGVKQTSGVTLTGNTESLDERMFPPEFFVPVHPTKEHLEQKSPVPLVLSSGSRGYDSIQVRKNRELIVRGPATLLVRDLRVENGAKLTFDTREGPVKLFVLHEAKFERGSRLQTSSGTPRDSYLFVGDGLRDGKEGKVVLGEGAKVHTLVFAPQDKVEVKDGAEVFGSIIADELELGERVRLHFDQTLGLQENQYPRNVSWRIVEMGAGPIDPFASHGLDRYALRSPADAHADLWLEIKYRSSAGVAKQEYIGWWNDFDWSVVFELAPHYRAYDSPGGKELIHVHP